ncbi:MAG: PqiC family protein [Deltaproteobacteria bacterium]|jgi:ABC-type uncharacterized transport system auxiliary subunit|nr:PqiC family protein [Deltaproteobacteria bacterium]
MSLHSFPTPSRTRKADAQPGPGLRLAIGLAVVALAAGGLFAGCGLSRPYPSIRSFDLEATGQSPAKGNPAKGQRRPAKVRRPIMIQVTSSGAAPQYETRKLVLKIGPNEFSEDFYNELVGMPSRLVAAQLASYLDLNSDRYRATQGVTAQSPDYTLDVYLIAFHGDYYQNPPRATVELKATLTDQRSSRPRTVMSNTYSGYEDLPPEAADRPKALATGLAQALNPVLAEIAADLTPALTGRR